MGLLARALFSGRMQHLVSDLLQSARIEGSLEQAFAAQRRPPSPVLERLDVVLLSRFVPISSCLTNIPQGLLMALRLYPYNLTKATS